MPRPPRRTDAPQRCGSGSAWIGQRHRGLGGHDLLRVEGAERLGGRGHAEVGGDLGADPAGVVERADRRAVAALDDRPVEEAPRSGRGHQRRHAHPTRRLTEHRHVVGVATEDGHVVAHPLQRRDLVAQAQVGGGSVEHREPRCAEPVVDAHDHDAVARERGPVVGDDGVGPAHERSAVDPDHDRQRARALRGPHVDVEVVVTGVDRAGSTVSIGGGYADCAAVGPCSVAVPLAVPRHDRLRCAVPVGAHRRVRRTGCRGMRSPRPGSSHGRPATGDTHYGIHGHIQAAGHPARAT